MSTRGGDVGDAAATVFWGRRLFSGVSLATGLVLVLFATPGISEGDRTFAVLGGWMLSSVVAVLVLVVWTVKLRANGATGAAASTLPLGPKGLLGGTLGLGIAAYVVGVVALMRSGASYDWTVASAVGVSVLFVAGIAGPVAALVQTYQLNARFPGHR